MNYEKIHKESIEIAKQLLAEGKISQECAERMFPELVESKDEKIRGNCIHFLELQKSHHASTVEIEECIAWLEKQGKQEIEPVDTTGLTDFEKCFQGMCCEKNKKFAKECCVSLLELARKQIMGEQKPAKEYSFNIESELFHQLTPAQQWLWKKEIEQAYNAGADKQKPAEWSEEDKQYLEDTLTILEGNRSVHTYGEVKNWLKSLKDRLQSKSMFNEKMDIEVWKSTNGQYVLKVNGNVIRGQLYDDAKLIYKHFFYLSEIESLKPQNRWRPSDEQMKALKEACDEHWEPDGLDPLYTLYQDLKKLREE